MEIGKILREKGFRFKKALGQNFLTDEETLGKIAAASGAGKDDRVLEIGCGAGTLTRRLAETCGKVVGVEIDRSLSPVLEKTLEGVGNAKILFCDVMKTPIAALEAELGGEYRLVANLPYYITTPAIMRFLEGSALVRSMTLTVQEEVALRLAARPATADYGAITAAIGAVGEAKIAFRIPRGEFYPAPNVDSAVVRIDIDREKFGAYPRETYRAAVRAAFSCRRKTLVNNLMQSFRLTREEAVRAAEAAGAGASARGEELSPEQFVRLAEFLAARAER